jgi:hypothetical protein
MENGLWMPLKVEVRPLEVKLHLRPLAAVHLNNAFALP